MTFGEKLLNLRRARGWTQEELADKIGVTRQALSKWEASSALPDTKNVVALAKLFGVTTDYLLCEDEGREFAANTQSAPRRISPLTLAGGFMFALGSAGMLCIGLLASIHPKGYGGSYGLAAYLMYYNIEWFFALMVISALAGAVLLFRQAFRKKLDESASVQAEIRAMREKEAEAQRRELYDSVKEEIRATRENAAKKDSGET